MKLIRLLLGIGLFIALAFSVSAMSISTNSFNFQILKNKNTSFMTQITNNENLTVYDVRLQGINYFTFPTIPNITKNSTIDYSFWAYTNDTLNTNLVSKLIWFYEEILLTSVDNYDVNVTSSGFVPNSITIDGNDNLVFHNKDFSAHTISEFNNIFTFDVDSNDTYVLSQDEVADYTIVDEDTGFILTLHILNKTQATKVHHSEKDISVNFHLEAIYPASSLDYEIYTDDFQIDYNGYADGVLRLTALDDVYNIHLSMPWTVFSQNDFSLAKDQSQIITFRIEPDVTKTSETNKTYNFNLNLTSSNTPKYQKSVKINIPYIFLGSEEDNKSSIEFVYLFDEQKCYSFCDKYPDKCPLKTETKLQYIVQKQNLTLSQDELQQMKEENVRLRNTVVGLQDKITGIDASTKQTFNNISGDLNYVKQKSEESLDAQKGRNGSFGFLIIFSVVVIFLGATTYLIPKIIKIRKSKQMKNEGHLS